MAPPCWAEWSDVVSKEVGRKPQQKVSREYRH